ncbi:MAG: hypothetical protein ACE15F_12765 [bacterium]
MLRQLGRVLAAGYILYFFSERLFWSTFRPLDGLTGNLITWLAYSAAAYVFLSVVWCFRVRQAHAIFIAGAIYGWLVEGVLAGTLYGTEPSAPFPISLSCTALSWHALITILLGWHCARTLLGRNRRLPILALASGLGLFWGFWASFQWKETPPVITPIWLFGLYGGMLTALLIGSYWLTEKLDIQHFRPAKTGVIITTLIHLLFFWGQVTRLGGRPLLILPPLLLMALCALRMDSRRAEPSPALSPIHGRSMKFPTGLLLFAMPLTATGAYAAAMALGDYWIPFHQVIWAVTIPLGAVFLTGSLVQVLRRNALPD